MEQAPLKPVFKISPKRYLNQNNAESAKDIADTSNKESSSGNNPTMLMK
jgi:hypothetical protein